MKKGLVAIVAAAMLGGIAGPLAHAQNLSPSPGWGRAMLAGPDARVKITEPYARMVARDTYFWAWPMLNIYNKRLGFGSAPELGLLDGLLPFAPVNRLAMLTDYVDPAERAVACPNQDVAYGGGLLALDVSPVVMQGSGFRRPLLGLSNRRSAHRELRFARQDVWNEAWLLSARRAELARRRS